MRLRTIILWLLLLACTAPSRGQTGSGHLRLVFAGDLMGHMPLHNAALQPNGSYDYAPCFQYVKDYIQSADVAIVNLEVTLAGKPYTGYPCFSAPDAIAEAAHQAGFDVFTTANNHCMDKGSRGLERTLDVLDTFGIKHLGTYRTVQERYKNHPLIVERNGIRLALLCYTYGTNGISVKEPNVVNMIDTAMMLRDLQTARLKNADFIIALMHWGIEYQKRNNREQEQVARWLFDNGCDAIVGGHPHVVQNLTVDANPDNDRFPEPVVYSMGNFLSNQTHGGTDGGIMFEMELTKQGRTTSLYSCAYMPYYIHRAVVDGRRQFHIVPVSDATAFPDSYGITPAALKPIKEFEEEIYQSLVVGQPQQRGYIIPERRYYNNTRPLPQYPYAGYFLNYGYPLSGMSPVIPAWRKTMPLAPPPPKHNDKP